MAASPILVVDDDHDTCASLSDILNDFGYRVDIAYEGRSALSLISGGDYRLALLDYCMPEMDGVELYRCIRQRSADVVGILVTGFASSDTMAAAKAAGFWDIVPKPVDLDRLLLLIETAVGNPAQMG